MLNHALRPLHCRISKAHAKLHKLQVVTATAHRSGTSSAPLETHSLATSQLLTHACLVYLPDFLPMLLVQHAFELQSPWSGGMLCMLCMMLRYSIQKHIHFSVICSRSILKATVHTRSNFLVLTANVAVQEGKYVAGVPLQPIQNVSGYTLFPFADLQSQYDLSPVLGSCSTNNSGLSIPLDLLQQVNNCTGGNDKCCYFNAAADDEVRPTLWLTAHASLW